MTTPSAFASTGCSIVIKTPLVRGGDFVGNYTPDINSYTHSISVSGGFVSADISIVGNHDFCEDWLQNGMGRHIEVYNPSLQIIWEGFVNQVDITMGYVSFTRGPLNSVGNRVTAWYVPIIEDSPEIFITGTEIPYTAQEDLASQALYGIWEKVINVGEQFYNDMPAITGLYLEDYAYPEGNPSISFGSGAGDFSVTLHCRGYIDWLEYIYNDENDNVPLEASELIKNILAIEPNGVISTSHSKIDYNPVLVNSMYVGDKTARTIIDENLVLGGGNYDRWLFGIYANREVVFSAIPTELEYVYYKTDRVQEVETISGEKIEPWNVVPGKWTIIPTFLTGMGIGTDLIRSDPRVFFGEEVNFTAPDQVTLNGSKIRKFSNMLEQYGLVNDWLLAK